MTQPRVKVALYGGNGHQLHNASDAFFAHCEVVACAELLPYQLEKVQEQWPECEMLSGLDELISRSGFDLIVLCSPMRSNQAEDTIRCLEAGYHVYAEKPCALNEADLDRIVQVAEKTGRIFHEMAGTVCGQPYWTMREIVGSGVLGDVIQVLVQKKLSLHRWATLR